MKLSNPEFEFRKFTRADYQAYKSWFNNNALKKTLGDIDEEWLDYIMKDEEGIELTVSKNGELVCVIGLIYPNAKESSYIITNIAVKPLLKNKGLGTKILTQLIEKTELKQNEYWAAYVEMSNLNGHRFFEKNDWKRMEGDDDMVRYEFYGKYHR